MRQLRLLIIDDSADDADLAAREVRRHYEVTHERVETALALDAALREKQWDLIICDYSLPSFDALAALKIIKNSAIDTPVIIVSGTIGEEAAVLALKAGAADFIVKGKYSRLLPAIERELRETEVRRTRREIEASLVASEQRFRTLVQSIDDLVFTLDNQQNVTGFFGKNVEKQFSGSSADASALMPSVFGMDPQIHTAANAVALSGKSTSYEWTLSSEEGHSYFQASLSPVFKEPDVVTGVVGVVRNTTEQTKLRAHLMVNDRMASVGILAAGIAHEINNPLTAVIGNLDIAVAAFRETNASKPDDEFMQILRDAQEGAQRVQRIVRDVKIFSRAPDERKSVPVDVREVLESSLRMAQNEIRYRARLIKDFADVPFVLADESRLGQVFINLIVNAAQALEGGREGRNEIRIRTRLDRPRKRVVAEVQDSGTGMAPDVLKNIFTPFFTTKPAGVGTGLGLPICKRIIAELNGELEVQSTPGEGSVFRVILPIAAETPSMELDAVVIPLPSHRSGKVLVVDDEPIITSIVCRILKEHDVTAVHSAADAIELLKRGLRYDAILCDMMMPDMSGMDLYRHVAQAVPEQAKVMIFTSGGLFTPKAASFLDEVTNARIEKPFQAQRLRALVLEHVR